VTVQNFGDSAISLAFNVWTRQENFLDIKDSMQESIKLAFDQHLIEMPFPQITLNTGEISPLSVNIQPRSP
jgi:small-conductance mechanosensitive channel